MSVSGKPGYEAAGLIGCPVAPRRARRRIAALAEEAASKLGEGERLLAVSPCTRGPRALSYWGYGVMLITGIVLAIAGDHLGSLAPIVFLAGVGGGFLLAVLAVVLSHRQAVVLTDRRLMIYRAGGVRRTHLRRALDAAPQGEVTTQLRRRLDGADLSLTFARPAGTAHVRLNFYDPYAQIARDVHSALLGTGTHAVPVG